jgi:hypothetical protein
MVTALYLDFNLLCGAAVYPCTKLAIIYNDMNAKGRNWRVMHTVFTCGNYGYRPPTGINVKN